MPRTLRLRSRALPPQVASALRSQESAQAPIADRVLGLDLALGACGWAVVDTTFSPPRLVATGVIALPSRRTQEDRADWNVRRFTALRQVICRLLVLHSFRYVAYEYPDRPFRTHWQTTRATRTQHTSAGSEFNAAQGLGLAEGFLIGSLADLENLTLCAVTIETAKQLVTGNANAPKERVRTMLSVRFGWNLKGKQPDEADAAAIAVACAYTPRPKRRTRKVAAA